jgi:hypothetical protein
LPPTLIDAAAITTFLPAGNAGQIVVRWPQPTTASPATAAQPTTVRIFEVDGPEPDKRKPLSEAAVTSVKPTPDKTYDAQAFSSTNSSIVRFIVPERADSFWEKRSFIIRVCGPGDKTGWALITARVSSPTSARIISLITLLLLYAGFASAIYKIHSAEHPLAPKYPAYKGAEIRGWTAYLNPVVLTAGVFNQGSIQKLQVLLFTLLVGGMVLSLVLTAGFLPAFSPTVAILLGISAVGAAVAQKTTTSNERLQFENWSWLVRKGVLPITRQDTPRWTDLVMNGREFDVYKVQTLIFSGVVAVALLVTGEDRLDSFTVPETLLGILGLSQVVYVAGALVRPPSVADLDKAVTELRGLEAKARTAIASNTDTDDAGNLLPTTSPLPAGHPPGKNALNQYDAKANQVEIMLESTLETEVDRPKLAPDLT